MNTIAHDHPPLEALIDYALDGADDAAAQAIDEHLMHCDACGERLDELMALRDGVRSALRAGAVSAVTTGAFVDRLAGRGLRIREYRLPLNGSVNCTVAPQDELLVSRLQVPPLQGVERLDALASFSLEPGVQHRLEDIPFDPRSGEVVYLPELATVRGMPEHTLRVQLLAVDAGGGTREVGHYTFHHRPWSGPG